MPAQQYEVFRVIIGRGLVDFCGCVTAASLGDAEDVARLMYPFDPSAERLDVVAEEPSAPQEPRSTPQAPFGRIGA